MDPILVSKEKFLSIIDVHQPLGLFYTQEDDSWIGMDNRTGHAWNEEFETHEECMEWLVN